jgi:hypothetical protein
MKLTTFSCKSFFLTPFSSLTTITFTKKYAWTCVQYGVCVTPSFSIMIRFLYICVLLLFYL